MATQSKTQYLADLQAYLKRRYKPKPGPAAARLPVIDAVVYGICHEDTTREQANQALSRFKDQFFDWNEVRVSPLEEVEETLADVPEPAARAQRIRRFLRQLFERTYSFTALEQLVKKPLKEALKSLHGFEAFTSDYVTATVIQQALGGHAIPIDEASRKALEKLGLHEPDVASLRGLIERAIPKNRGAEFLDLLEDMAHDPAIETDSKVPRWAHQGKPGKPSKEVPEAPARSTKAPDKGKAKAAPAPEPEPAPAPPKAKKPAPKEPPPAPPKKGGKGKPGE
ncbi:endonuclease [Paludisphaera mucosa]|uniref:Endonuclease n=1 Tax=Paludisphaera mucosa TaxID=3030827 RepID=A0ABT6FCM0_9BACT|nr:endonuclease [Paludisphaera mucosa]MDG3005110.1 endonuclease [Paludisphaera mucosa]